jgi:uncharacterized protein (DUF58 family)
VTARATALMAAALGLLALALATRRAELAWMATPLLTALAWAALRAPRREEAQLEARRLVRRAPGGGIAVTATVRNTSARRLHLRLEELAHPAPPVERGAPAGRFVLGPGEQAALRYAFAAPRGRFAWTGLRAAASDPLGLLEASSVLDAPGALHVLPDAPRLRALALRPGRTLPSPGSIPARVGGSGTELHGVREYRVGDALRRVDWRRVARHPGGLFSKEFEQERIADVGLVLDGRAIPRAGPGALDVFEHGLRATASLASTFVRQGNRVSLLVLGEAEARVFPGAGRVHLRRLLACLAAARPTAFATAAPRSGGRELARLFPAGAVVFAVTPLTAGDPTLLLRLRAGGRQVVVVSPDPVALGAPALPRDAVAALALRAARIERQLGLRALAQLRMTVVDWQVERPLHPLLREALRPARGGRA